MTDLKDLILNLKMVMFGGKGGVGKTSTAASAAIWAAEHGRNTLIISTDPAHSLGDSLGIELPPGEPTKVEGIEKLTALEINPKANLTEFKGITNMNPIKDMDMGGFMGNFGLNDIEDFTSMNPPGIDEALAFGKILEFIETEHDYDLIIFDTAPTGHTLRILSLPETLSGWIGKILKLKLRMGKFLGTFKKLFSGGAENQDDNSLELLERLKKSIINAKDDLSDPTKNSFIIVMIPEEMAITETGRLLSELIRYNIPVSNIIVNQLYTESTTLCDFCKARREMQQKNLNNIRELFGKKLQKNLIEIPLFKQEIRTYPKLKEMGEYLCGKD